MKLNFEKVVLIVIMKCLKINLMSLLTVMVLNVGLKYYILINNFQDHSNSLKFITKDYLKCNINNCQNFYWNVCFNWHRPNDKK